MDYTTSKERAAAEDSNGCTDVAVSFTCTYEVMVQGDIPATAIVVAHRNQFYDINSQFVYARETHTATWLDLNEAGDKLCRLGYGC